MIKSILYLSLLSTGLSATTFAQEKKVDPPTLTEVWKPVPKLVTPGSTDSGAPSDAIVLFGGKDASAFIGGDGKAVKWKIADGSITVEKGTGMITTKSAFGDCQLHIEWRSPEVVKGNGQGRGNSGIFLMGKYELQVLDSYNNSTYSNGQAGSIYKQLIPLANATRKPGEWQSYDVVFMAPRFNEDGSVKIPAHITVIHNGVLVQNHAVIAGSTQYIGAPSYEKHGDKEPLSLQDHGDAVSYRNIWIRNL
jgi:hypothetical protein